MWWKFGENRFWDPPVALLKGLFEKEKEKKLTQAEHIDMHAAQAKRQQCIEATCDFVEATFDFVAFDNVASTLLLVWTGCATGEWCCEWVVLAHLPWLTGYATRGLRLVGRLRSQLLRQSRGGASVLRRLRPRRSVCPRQRRCRCAHETPRGNYRLDPTIAADPVDWHDLEGLPSQVVLVPNLRRIFFARSPPKFWSGPESRLGRNVFNIHLGDRYTYSCMIWKHFIKFEVIPADTAGYIEVQPRTC